MSLYFVFLLRNIRDRLHLSYRQCALQLLHVTNRRATTTTTPPIGTRSDSTGVKSLRLKSTNKQLFVDTHTKQVKFC